MTQAQERLETGFAAAVLGVALSWSLCGVAFANGPGAVAMHASKGLHEVPKAAAAGRGSQGYLGVDIRDVRDDEIGTFRLKESLGAIILHVDHDGPAGKCGLRERDVIVQMNGQTIEGEEQLRRMIKETPAGRTVTLQISRDGQQINLSTQMANREAVEKQAWQQHLTVPEPADSSAPAPEAHANDAAPRGNGFWAGSAQSLKSLGTLTLGSTYTGAIVETMGSQLAEFFGAQGGVLVHSVDANSPAAVAGLHAGDVVVRVNATKVASNSDWLKIVRENKGKKIALVVVRDKKEQTLMLIPDTKKRSRIEPWCAAACLPSSEMMAATQAGAGSWAQLGN